MSDKLNDRATAKSQRELIHRFRDRLIRTQKMLRRYA